MRRTAVIGPGRVGTALAMALTDAGYHVVAVAGRSESSLARFVERVPTAVALPAAEAASAAELVVVAVRDDALEAVVRDVARDGGVVQGSRWIHTSGGYGTEVLRPARRAGASVAACHPAQTFPDPDTGYEGLPQTGWAVTADEADLGWARVLVTDLRGSPVTIPSDARTLGHAGLTVASNATDAVVTVACHLEELRATMPEAVEAYLALSRLALRHAARAGLDPGLGEAIGRVLGVEEAP